MRCSNTIAAAILSLQITSASAVSAQERLSNVNFSTKGSIVLMPCMDKSGSNLMSGGNATENEFCTETYNQLIRDGGAKTVSWFKVSSELEKIVKELAKIRTLFFPVQVLGKPTTPAIYTYPS